MGLENRIEKRMGESVKDIMKRNASDGKSIRHCSMLMDVSYTSANRWAHKYGVKFNADNPFRSWRFK